jgi:hypothetical protein
MLMMYFVRRKRKYHKIHSRVLRTICACMLACVRLCGTTGHWGPGLKFSWFLSRACRVEMVGFLRGVVAAFALLGCYVAYVGPIDCPETLVTSYELTPRNIQEGRTSRVCRYWIRFLRRGISLSQDLHLHKVTQRQ